MDKDRDISRKISTPKKVGFVGSALLAGSALVAACGGGAKSATTPEGGVGGEAANPGGGSSPIVVKTEAMPSATAVKEAPTVAPTATVEAKLTQEQMLQIAGNVKQLITSGLSETPVTAEQISGNPIASNDYLDPGFVSTAVALCDLNNYGSPFVLSGRTVQPGDFDYASEFLINCAQPAIASKVLYKASGNEKFKQANEAWKPLHKQIVDEVRKKDPKISENFWKTTLNLYYTLQ